MTRGRAVGLHFGTQYPTGLGLRRAAMGCGNRPQPGLDALVEIAGRDARQRCDSSCPPTVNCIATNTTLGRPHTRSTALGQLQAAQQRRSLRVRSDAGCSGAAVDPGGDLVRAPAHAALADAQRFGEVGLAHRPVDGAGRQCGELLDLDAGEQPGSGDWCGSVHGLNRAHGGPLRSAADRRRPPQAAAAQFDGPQQGAPRRLGAVPRRGAGFVTHYCTKVPATHRVQVSVRIAATSC